MMDVEQHVGSAKEVASVGTGCSMKDNDAHVTQTEQTCVSTPTSASVLKENVVAQFDITDSAVKYGYEGLLSLSSSILSRPQSDSAQKESQQPVTDKLNVVLFQKKRGNGGVWQPIEENERIRVDKSKGKLLRLVVSPTAECYNINDKGWDFTFQMNSLRNGSIAALPGDGFTVDVWQLKQSGNESKEFKIKLTRISKSQNFFVSAYRGSVMLLGSSITFRSDDNGKVYTSNKKPRLNTAGSPSSALAKKNLQPLKAINPSLYSLCSDSDFVNMIAQSLVPVLLDKISQTTSPNMNSIISSTSTPTPPPATTSESPVIQTVSTGESTCNVNIPIPTSLLHTSVNNENDGNEPPNSSQGDNQSTEASSFTVSSLQSQSNTLPTLSPLTQ